MEKAKAEAVHPVPITREAIVPNPKKRLLDQVREVIRLKHYSIRTEQTYIDWIKRYIFFHGKRHPREMGASEIESFLTDLAVRRRVSASTQNQALNALVFLYRQVLHQEAGEFSAVRAKRSNRLPVVLTKSEVDRLFGAMKPGTCKLMARLLYGTGMRLMECVRLRVKDVLFEENQIIVREGKGAKDRVTVFPEALKPELQEHLRRVKLLHERDLAAGFGHVYLPYALAVKNPLEEQPDDQKDEADGFEQSDDDGLDGVAHPERRVIHHGVINAGGKLPEILQLPSGDQGVEASENKEGPAFLEAIPEGARVFPRFWIDTLAAGQIGLEHGAGLGDDLAFCDSEHEFVIDVEAAPVEVG